MTNERLSSIIVGKGLHVMSCAIQIYYYTFLFCLSRYLVMWVDGHDCPFVRKEQKEGWTWGGGGRVKVTCTCVLCLLGGCLLTIVVHKALCYMA